MENQNQSVASILVLGILIMISFTPSLGDDRFPPGHTLAVYPGPSQECQDMQVMASLSPEMQELIVVMHNKKRDEHADSDKGMFNNGMSRLVWNQEMATTAQRWADQCEFGNDVDRSTLDGYSNVGQYVYLGYSKAPAKSRESRHVVMDVGRSGDEFDVMLNMGDVHANLNISPQFEKLLVSHGVLKKAGTVGIVNEDNSNFGRVVKLLSGLDSEFTIGDMDVDTLRGDLTVELMPVEYPESDGILSVPCAVERDGRDLEVNVGITGDCHDVSFDWGEIDLELNFGDDVEDQAAALRSFIEESRDVEWKILLGKQLDMLMGKPKVETTFSVGSFSVVDRDSRKLKMDIGRSGEDMDVEFDRGDIVVELFPRVDNEEDGVNDVEHVQCVMEKDGRDLVVEVEVSGDCHDVLFDWGDVTIDVAMPGDHVKDIFVKHGAVQEAIATGVFTEANSDIDFIEMLVDGVVWETKLGDGLVELLGQPEVETNFAVGDINLVERVLQAEETVVTAADQLIVSIANAVTSWFGESVPAGGLDHILVSSFKLTLGDGSEVSQLTYADTTEIGCGLSKYKYPAYPDWDYTLLVCNYA